MRDIFVTLLVAGSLPYIFRHPWFGSVMWVWISVMNLHSQGWGFARSMPFAAIIAGTVILSMVFNKEKFRLPSGPVTVLFLTFMVWMGVTSVFALHADQVSTQWIKVYKIFGMTAVVMMLLKSRRDIEALIWTILVSLGFYGVKGGIFTIRSGGNERVWGPTGTFIDGNNELALALVMVIPIIYYCFLITKDKRGRIALMAAGFLCALSALGSYSRGAALAIGVMGIFLWLKSKNKAALGVLMAMAVPVLLLFMPDKWYDRIDTIQSYEEDASALGRLNAWRMAYNLALDRPLVGGGFEIYDPITFLMYAPIPEDVHAAHSIYFQVLGEHGFVGLALYLALGFMTWRTGSAIIKAAKGHEDLKWAADLATMLQVSLLGFAAGGAFLSLAYFDVPYYVMAAMVATRVLIDREVAARKPPPRGRAPLAPPPSPEPNTAAVGGVPREPDSDAISKPV